MAIPNPIVPENSHVLTMFDAVESIVPGFDRTALASAIGLFEFSSRAARTFETYFGRYGLSRGRFLVLLVLLLESAVRWTPAMLAERGGVTRATMTSLLDTLEKDGDLRREAFAGDRRRQIVQLTTIGRKRITEMLPIHFSRVSQAFAPLTARERNQLETLLGKVSIILNNLVEAE